MRTFALIALVFGAVAAKPFFPSGHEFEFNYKGKIMSGIPKLDSHFAGLSMSSKVVLQALDSRTFKLALKDVRFTRFNEKLTGLEPENWRLMHTPEPEETTSEYKSVLESPVEFTMVEGEVKEIKSSKEEATWTINFKKSLISLIKIQSPSGRIDISQNNVRTETGRLPEIWSVMEEGVDGECENTYQFIEVPTYMLSEMTYGKMGMESCEERGMKAYQITKTRNVNKCTKRTSWTSVAPVELDCEQGNCDLVFEKSSMTRYLGCGSSAEDVELKVILNQGDVVQNLMGYNTENIVTGTEQTLEVVEKRSTLSSLPEISSPRTSESLFSEYPSSFFTGETPEDSLIRQRSASPSPRESFLKKLSPSTLKQKMVEKISQIVRDLKEVEEFEKKQVSAHVLTLSRSLFLLDEEEMKSLFEELKGLKMDEEDRETARQLFLEIALTSGSNSSIKFLKKMIETGELSSLRIGEIIATLPHYIKTPTVEIMTDIFEIIKSPVVTRHSLLKYNANLAFANLVNKVCISSTRLVRFPIFVFGEFCSHEKLTGEYIPHLVEELKSAETTVERNSAILALGELGHESVIPILLPYIEGKSEKSNPIEQRMAIYSLSSVTTKHRHILYPIYSAMVFNPTEPREARIAALAEMLRMQPSMVEFQKLATSTWFEQDAEFLKFVVSTLKSLSNIEPSELPQIGLLYELSIKARTVYPLSKPVPGIISSSLNAFTSEWLKELQIGYNMHGAYVFTGKKMSVYGRLEFVLQQLRTSPIEFAISAQGPRSLVEKVTELLGGEIQSLERLHPEWRSIISSIELQAREELPFHAGSWVKVLNDIQVVTGLDSTMLERLVESGKQYISEPSEWKKYICGKKNINLVKVTNISPSEILFPSEMGLHIGVVHDMPSVLSLRGEIEIDCSVSKPSLTLDLTKKLSTSAVGIVGVHDPISEEVLAVGVSQEWSVNYPSKITAEVVEGKLKVKYTPNKEVSPNTREIDLVTYSVKPFAVNKPHPYSDLTPLIAHENTKLIRSSGERKSDVYHFGETLGLGMKFEMNTETEINDMKSALEMMSLYNYNPLNAVLFPWTNTAVTLSGRPSCRYHEVKMVYSPEKSSTKKVELEFGLTVVRQLKNEPLKKIVIQKVPAGLQIASEHLQASSQSQKLQQKVSQLTVEEGYGFTANVDLKLDGGERKTYNWEMTAFHGFSGVQQKWNLHLEDKERLNICIDGEVSLPLIPLKDVRTLKSENMRFSYKNTVGFGKTCKDHEIKVVGATYRSEEQKERSEVGRSSRKCEEATRKVEELREEVRSIKEESSEKRKLENELERMVEEKEEHCTRYIEELSTLDQVKFRIESTPMPSYVRKYTRVLDSAVKTVLLPYMSRIEGGNNKEREVEVELRFNSELNTLNMALTTEHETIDYHNIRLPEELRGLVPLRSTVRPHEQIIKSVVGSSVYEKCSIGDGVVKTFDNKTYSYELDDCYHVLSSDCSKSHSHAILGKVVDGKKEIEIFVEGSKVTMKPTSSWTESRREYEVTVDGKVVRVEENEKKEVTSRNGKISYRIHRSADDVMILETPFNRITYNGKTVELEHARNSAHQCGLCGNLDSIKANDIKTAQFCVAKSLKQAALTYRVQKSCSPLSAEQQKIVSQQVTCAQNVQKISYTPIAASILEKCQVTKHSMIRQAGKLCISQIPIVECGSGCASRSTITRSVPFTCLPSNRERVSKLYTEKVVRGEILPELRNMEKTFAAQMQVPVSCAHPSL